MKVNPPIRSDYRHFRPIQTRWMDNDVYGHVNNVVYYSYFDTIANQFLIEEGGFNFQTSPVVGYIVNSECHYHRSFSFPQQLEGAFRANRIGSSSAEYGIAIFREGDTTASAHGTFTHVFVDRETEQSSPIPISIRTALEDYLISF